MGHYSGSGTGLGMGAFNLSLLFESSGHGSHCGQCTSEADLYEEKYAEEWPPVTSSSPTDLPGQGEECAPGGGSQGEVAPQAAAEVSPPVLSQVGVGAALPQAMQTTA